MNDNAKVIIAPKYWARHNVSDGYWSTGDAYTRPFLYMDRDGKVSDYYKCKIEAIEYYKSRNLI